MDQYRFMLYKHDEARQYRAGEAVYVWLKSQYSTGRAVVLSTPECLPPDSPFAGRYRVRFTARGSTAHVRPERLLPVFTRHTQHQNTLLSHQEQPHQQEQEQEECQPQQQQQQQQEQQRQQQQQQGLVLLVSATVDYRRLARSQVLSCDGVLELGCSYGVASRMLEEHGAWLVAVDNSEEVVREARARSPHISFHTVDVLEEQQRLLQLAGCCCCCPSGCKHTTTITISSSSSSSSSSPNSHACCCSSGCKHTANGNDTNTISSSSSSSPDSDSHAGSNGSSTAAAAAVSSHTCEQCDAAARSPPCNVVFADIGGNRQLDSLVKLVPWVLRALKPRLLVVKSEELAAAAEQQVGAEQQQQQQPLRQCKDQTAVTSPTSAAAHPQETPAAAATAAGGEEFTAAVAAAAAGLSLLSQGLSEMSLQECDSVIHDVTGWWQRLEQQCGNPASLAEPWFIAARAAGFTRNPMRYPQRSTADGTRICRPHNYDRDRGCLKADSCQFDHEHCHHCLKPGHRAFDCPVH